MNHTKFARFFRRTFLPLVVGVVLVASTNVWAGTTHRIGVDGLACPFCAYGVEKQLMSIPGVKSVKVTVKSGTVIVTMQDGAKLSRGRAGQAVKDAGFSMRSFK